MSACNALETVTDVMADILKITQDKVNIDADMESIGVDEMVQVIIASELEHQIGLKIPDIDLQEMKTGRCLVDYIESRMKK